LDILVNNAGALSAVAIDKFVFADFERMIALNITGAFVGAQEQLSKCTTAAASFIFAAATRPDSPRWRIHLRMRSTF
jgi:NAD(P)-dependent dehydrogenase (short-subunit alcohol dehydrogenase family)